MSTEFERKVVEKLSNIERVVNRLDELNRNIEQWNKHLEELIKLVIEKARKRGSCI